MDKKLTMTEEINTALEALSRKILPALVVVRSHRHRAGAGVIWHTDGLVLTNHHVLGKRSPWVQIEDGREVQAKVLADEPDLDLALLRIPVIGLPAIEVEENLPRVGELVFAFGHPWGQRGMVTSGVISALVSAQTQARRSLTLLRTDVPLAPGSSGGPLVSARGKMTGINNMVVGGDQSVAIPAQTIRSFVDAGLAGVRDREWRQVV